MGLLMQLLLLQLLLLELGLGWLAGYLLLELVGGWDARVLGVGYIGNAGRATASTRAVQTHPLET